MLKIAHRGASGHELENSYASMKKAIELGADIIEADVQLTKDDVPIIMHDKLLDRTTNTSGYTTDFNWAEYNENIRLKNGEKVPSLEDFCREISKSSLILYLDIKPFGNEAIILNTCKKMLSYDQYFMGSFHNHSIKLIKQMDSRVTTIMIMEGMPVHIQTVIENADCDIVALGFDTLEEDTVLLAQEMSLKVFAWTVNDIREIKRAISLGVDGITSDFPDIIPSSFRSAD